ncbi:UNVERIFIED_CONTAM: Abscisic acid 8'-hydroxylase [Sesamum radiatum]|uniref:Abscisic acid 8'-hydroxylase n=1 Tax=Sesamum radiatum TaxID=300843 RepID=A0AAW2KZB8_SESRA
MEFISLCLFPFAALILSFLLLLKFTPNFLSFGHIKLPLPPGTMGWPYIGETFQLYSQNPNTFFASKVKNESRARFESKPLQAHIPASKERILGKQAIFFHQGDYHAKLRKLVLRAFMPEAIKNIVSDIESIAVNSLESWEGKLITTFQEMKTSFNFHSCSMHSTWHYFPYLGRTKFCTEKTSRGAITFLKRDTIRCPSTFPDTFPQAMKARKELAQILAKILSLRRQTKQDHNDLLGSFMGDSEGLTDEQIADNIIGVIFAARDTTASVLTWILKYLAENPSVLQAVTEEQEAIKKAKEECGGEEKALNWADTKKMPITTRVILETLRVASILSFTFREAVEDVEFNGYLIPKGWKVLPLFRNIHHSPDNFPEPEKFDPSRFEVAPKPNTFMPFGNGTHACPGNELAKLEILVLLHHLTTKYRWSVMAPQNGIQYGPFPLPQNGLPIKLSLKK